MTRPRFLLVSPGYDTLFVTADDRASAIKHYAKFMEIRAGEHVFCTSVPDLMGEHGSWVTIERGEVSFRPYVKGRS